MKDDAGNLLFSHNGEDYRIYNFNWRLQRDFLNKLMPIQVPDASGETVTSLLGDDSALAQDYIFSKTQINKDGNFIFIDRSVADSIFNSYQDSIKLFQKILLEVNPFLSGGSESSPQKQKSVKNQDRTISKPNRTSKT